MFITFEGGEGAGKSTQIQRLAARILQNFPDSAPLITREPGDGPLGPQLRSIVLDKKDGVVIPERAELLIMLADRAQHVECIIRPALKSGRIVLCDRYADSSVAYQGYARQLDPVEIARLNTFATGGLVPDHTFLLDIDPAVGLTRQAVKTSMEREPTAFHNRVRDGFLRLSIQEPDRFTVIDASQDPDKIAEQIWSAVQTWISGA